MAEIIKEDHVTAKKYFIRVISIAAAHPVDGTWKDVQAILDEVWKQSTSLANWAVLEWVKAEPCRLPGQEKMPKVVDPYHYGLFQRYEGREYWTGAAANANCIFQAVRKYWIKNRYAVCWQRRQAPPVFRYPYPFRVHQASAKVWFDADGRPCFSAALPGGRIGFVLRSGQNYRRQIKQLRMIVDGNAKICECMFDKNRKTGQTIIRVVAKFEESEKRESSGEVQVKLGGGRFLAATFRGQQWFLNGDHVRRWVVSHAAFRQRMSEDLKHEKRWPAKVKKHMLEALDLRCRKQNDRMTSWLHESSHQLVQWAVRQRAGKIVLDDSDPWFDFNRTDFRAKLAYKCELAGVEFEVAIAEVVETQATAETVPSANGVVV